MGPKGAIATEWSEILRLRIQKIIALYFSLDSQRVDVMRQIDEIYDAADSFSTEKERTDFLKGYSIKIGARRKIE